MFGSEGLFPSLNLRADLTWPAPFHFSSKSFPRNAEILLYCCLSVLPSLAELLQKSRDLLSSWCYHDWAIFRINFKAPPSV